ncbi:hypothetical protein ACS2JQ_18530 [Bacillus cereus group sp. BceL101]|uniref:hypothetical protein n=1 Tax=Bacillus TaxID=1386 RepID=UPI0003135377|nr:MULTISPECIES: hypothetical protein [Bacillus cereus group]KXY95152.1 hypothetical protein AT279_21785 [Bacillus cereus]MCC2419312.1 hypothetical protein [Bacillus pacificus]MCU5005751.1 hypothetical protein [Bacillus pacificus]MCU5253454.1 hypothetical protein [Bacillus cereus]MCU5259217.1 hypothetical protein [Bacillus pacificus]
MGMNELQRYTAYKNGEEYDASEFVGVMIKTAAYSVGKYGMNSFDGLLKQLTDSEIEIFEKLVIAVGDHIYKTNEHNERK